MTPTLSQIQCTILYNHGWSDQRVAKDCGVREGTIFKIRSGQKRDYIICEKLKPLVAGVLGQLSQEERKVLSEVTQEEDTLPPNVTPEQTMQGVLDRFYEVPENDYERWAREDGGCTLKVCEEETEKLVMSQIEGKMLLLCPLHHSRYKHITSKPPDEWIR